MLKIVSIKKIATKKLVLNARTPVATTNLRYELAVWEHGCPRDTGRTFRVPSYWLKMQSDPSLEVLPWNPEGWVREWREFWVWIQATLRIGYLAWPNLGGIIGFVCVLWSKLGSLREKGVLSATLHFI